VNPDLKVWNLETSQVVRHLRGHKGAVYSLAAAGDGGYFVSVGTDKTLKIWDLRSASPAATLHDPKLQEMSCVALNNCYTNLST
jgi:WD40 repeat protein